jgi:hypothetical protein
MTCRRGQASIESLLAIVFALFILVTAALLASEKNSEGNSLKLRTDAKRVCTSMADNINTIAEEGSGFYKYFSIPATLYGENDYNVTPYGNLIEITSGDYSYLRDMITSNVTIYCLNKSLNLRNKVYSDQENIYIICNKPELMIINSSFRANNSYPPIRIPANSMMNLTIGIMNFGPVNAGPFNISFNLTSPSFNDTKSYRIPLPGLASESKTEASVITNNRTASPGNYYINVTITVDSLNEIKESTKSNNVYKGTIYVY